LYKQTQFGVPRREEACRCEQTKPIGRSESCDNASLPGVVPATNPIWGSPGGVGRPILRNKANWEEV
jgi:hypothetical protein